MTALRTGEGDGAAARLGRSARGGIRRAKSGLKNLGISLGFAPVDAYEEDVEDQRRRKRARAILGDDGPSVFLGQDASQARDLRATVAPEFRAQVAAGLAAANTLTTGSTLVNAPLDDADDGF